MDSLLEGYCRQHYSHHLPSDINYLIGSYYHHGTYFVNGGNLCIINIIGNILTCEYPKYQFMYDLIRQYIKSILMCIFLSMGSMFIYAVIHISYFIISYIVFSIIFCLTAGDNHCRASILYENSEYLISFINHYAIRYFLLILSIWCSFPHIFSYIDDFLCTKPSVKRQNICYVSTKMNQENNAYEYRLKVLKVSGKDISLKIGLIRDDGYMHYELTSFDWSRYYISSGHGAYPSGSTILRRGLTNNQFIWIRYYPARSTFQIIMQNKVVFECDKIDQYEVGEYKFCLKMEFIDAGCVELVLV